MHWLAPFEIEEFATVARIVVKLQGQDPAVRLIFFYLKAAVVMTGLLRRVDPSENPFNQPRVVELWLGKVHQQ